MKKQLVGAAVVLALAAGGMVSVLGDAGAAPPRPTSLAEAASQPQGIGARRLASGLEQAPRPDTDPKQVVPDTATKTGGCVGAYGRPGQCLPTIPPSQAEHVAMGHMQPHWDCTEVRTIFRKGLAVRARGVDPLGLDRDHDGTACGKND